MFIGVVRSLRRIGSAAWSGRPPRCQPTGYRVNPIDVWLVGQGLQRSEPQPGISQARREDIEVARIADETDRPQTLSLITR